MFIVRERGLKEATQKLSNVDGKLKSALNSLVMRTLKQAKTDADQKISQRYTVATGIVTRTIRLKAAGFSGQMSSTGRNLPLSKFIVRPKRRPRKMPAGGVYTEVVRGAPKQLPHAFLMKNGEPYERVGRPRFPIRRHWGPSAPRMLASSKVAPFIIDRMQQRLEENIVQAAAQVF